MITFTVYIKHLEYKYFLGKKNGDSEGIRTPDRRLRRPLLYPAELRNRVAYFFKRYYYISFIKLLQEEKIFLVIFIYLYVKIQMLWGDKMTKNDFLQLKNEVVDFVIEYEFLQRKINYLKYKYILELPDVFKQ